MLAVRYFEDMKARDFLPPREFYRYIVASLRSSADDVPVAVHYFEELKVTLR
jgi:hypothetical protein